MKQLIKVDRASEALIAAFPILAVFLLIPVSSYVANQDDFYFGTSILWPFVGTATAAGVVAYVLAPLRSRWLLSGLFYLGWFFVVSDVLFPVRLKSTIDDPDRVLANPRTWEYAVQALLLIGVAVCAWKLPVDRFLKKGAAIILVVVAMGIADFGFKVQKPVELDGFINPGQTQTNTKETPAGNVYHLYVDAYSNNVFEENVTSLGLNAEFSGFVHYPEARSNYVETIMSRASFLQSAFHHSGSINQFANYAWREKGIVKAAKDAGYRIWSYTSLAAWHPVFADYRSTGSYMHEDAAFGSHLVALADMALLRATPVFLRRQVFKEHKGFFDRLNLFGTGNFRISSLTNFRNFKRFIDDEDQRRASGEYVYAHFLHPHAPYVFDEQCQVAGETDYFRQSKCTTKLLAEFIQELKRLNRYESSVIAVHGDHGEWRVPPLKERGMQIDSPFYTLDQKSRPLLAFKPRNAPKEPLRANDELVQLLDLAPTIAKLAEFPFEGEGQSVYPTRKEPLESVTFFFGFYNIRTALQKGKPQKMPRYKYDGRTRRVTRDGALRVVWAEKNGDKTDAVE